jgi:hypothetical protein
VKIEIFFGLGLLRVFELAQTFGLTVRKPVGLGLLVVLPPLGLLARASKIDQFSHSTPPAMTGCRFRGSL